MSSNQSLPDYELEDLRIVSSTAELHALAHPLRETVLDLLLERAASVAELAEAVGRPKSTMAHHVGVLLDAGLVRVARTRRIRAIDERFYGRTARIYYIGAVEPEQVRGIANPLAVASGESKPAAEADTLRAILRHARISRAQASEFWDRVFALTREFSAMPRSGDQTFGFVAGLYPTDYPSLPERGAGRDADPDSDSDPDSDRDAGTSAPAG
jgi:DNA-binding transcriptional ArsR family regulator